MTSPGFLTNPEVRRWLNGVEPAWTMLDFDSFNALHDEPSASNPAIRLEPNLTATEISASAVTANALFLLRRAAETGGLKLTATGNLSRAMVDDMCGSIECPNYDKDELFRYQKVVNEPDFLPLHFVRILAQAAKLLRTHRGRLVPTRLGKRMLAFEPRLFRPIRARFLASDSSGRHPVVAFGVGTRLAAERDTHAALHVSRHRRSGVGMGSRFQCDGGSHSPTFGLVWPVGITNPSEVADRCG